MSQHDMAKTGDGWLAAQEARMRGRIRVLRDRARRIEEHLAREAVEALPEEMDRAQLHENDEVVDALGALVEEDIAALEAAVARIADGTYGACVECDAPIAKGRLESLPATPFCVDCAASHAPRARAS